MSPALPSRGARRRAPLVLAACLVLASLALATPAAARDVLVLSGDGRVSRAPDAGARLARLMPDAWPSPRRATRPPSLRHGLARAAAARRPTVPQALAALVRAGRITAEERAARVKAFADARRLARRLTGKRRVELVGVLTDIATIAGDRQLTAPRIAPLWLTLERNVEWWRNGPLLVGGQRVEFEGSGLVWQHYLGHGIQIQWLGTFGKLNWLGRKRGGEAEMTALTDEALALATPRAGGIAWESLFPFGGGRALWVSALTQGTALQALSTSAVRAGRVPELLPTLRRGLRIFEKAPPSGVRVTRPTGVHYVQYSSTPGLYVLNGFIQSLVGLFDFARVSADARAQAVFGAGHAGALRETPTYDTGAWSLYSQGTVRRESDLHYHDLVTDFLSDLCERTQDAVHCATEANFADYRRQPPEVDVRAARLRARRSGAIPVWVDKASRLDVEIRKGPTVVLRRAGLSVARGGTRIWWWPAARGAYEIRVTATDLAGNQTREVEPLTVIRR
jgi:hypothetical protein